VADPARSASNRRIEAFIFDLFGVLISFDDNHVYERIAQHCPDPATLSAIQGLVSNEDLIRGRMSLAELHAALVAAHGLTLSLEAFEGLWLLPYSAPEPGMGELVRGLAQRYRLVLLSNVDRYYWEMLYACHPELGHFDVRLLSWELGAAKPEPAVFARAVEAAGVPAPACLLIDDKAQNVAAAKRAGLQAYRYVGMADLCAELKALGVEVPCVAAAVNAEGRGNTSKCG
jgi:HAD superfamily hydrolase (TIGR01509 family)